MQVLSACELGHDLRSMPHGDATPVTDGGDSLSGGQQARVSLARTLYTRADVYLLDEPLAALDGRVATSVLQGLLLGPLLEDATLILVSSHPAALAAADFVVRMHAGEVQAYTSQSPGPTRGLPPAAGDSAAPSVHSAATPSGGQGGTAVTEAPQSRASFADTPRTGVVSSRGWEGDTTDTGSASDLSPHRPTSRSALDASALLAGWRESHELSSDMLGVHGSFGGEIGVQSGWCFGAAGASLALRGSDSAAAAAAPQPFTADPASATMERAELQRRAGLAMRSPLKHSSSAARAMEHAGAAQRNSDDDSGSQSSGDLPVSISAGTSRGVSCQVPSGRALLAAEPHSAQQQQSSLAHSEQMGKAAVQDDEFQEVGHVKGSVYR